MSNSSTALDQTDNKTSQNDRAVSEVEAWWKTGFTVWQNVHGKLLLNRNGATMLDKNGQPAFKLNYRDIKKAHIGTG